MTTTLLIAGMLGSATLGGIYFTFSTFVMKALAQLPQAAGVEAMQRINVTVLNPWFLGLFVGTPLVSLGAAVLTLWGGVSAAAVYALGGAVLHCVGAFGVTVVKNVPLNDELAGTPATSPDSGPLWKRYLARWTFWNHVRTVASLLAALAFAVALVHPAGS